MSENTACSIIKVTIFGHYFTIKFIGDGAVLSFQKRICGGLYNWL